MAGGSINKLTVGSTIDSSDIDVFIMGSDREQLFKEILEAARKTERKPRLHIEVDTGMRRGGFLDEWNEFLEVLNENRGEVSIIGLWTHFARADEPDSNATPEQISTFEGYLQELKSIGIEPTIIHLSNSAATLRFKAAHKSLVRLGIAMYGLSPDVTTLGPAEDHQLKPAMTLKAKLALVKFAPEGSAVGYGGTAVLKRATHLGLVVMGYSDGIPRNTSAMAGVTSHEKKAPIVGRVSMDQFVVDLGEKTESVAGEYVTIFGSGTANYSIDEWAAAANTINYEIVTRIASRVERIYVN